MKVAHYHEFLDFCKQAKVLERIFFQKIRNFSKLKV